MDFNPHANKRALIYNMTQGNSVYQKLLDGLSTKEVQILRKNPDLVDSVRDIVKLTPLQALAELQEEYNLEIDQYNSSDVWVSTENLEDCIPEWFNTNHCGWFKSTGDEEFLEWAREFLMQEIRINIWIRYLEHKKDPKPDIGYGMYL